MANSKDNIKPAQQPAQPPQSPKKGRGRILQVALGVSALGMAAAAGGGLWLTNYIQNELAPQIQTQLSELLQRPVEVGELEQFNLYQLRFGPSAMPPIASDPDKIYLEAIEVQFNPWQVLETRKVKLGIIAVKPQVYLEQEQNGAWLDLQIEPPEPGQIEIEITQVSFKGGKVELVPMDGEGQWLSPAEITELQGNAEINQGAEQVKFQVEGQLVTEFSPDGSGSDLELAGQTDFQLQQVDLQVEAQDLPILGLLPLAQNTLDQNQVVLPIELTSGIASPDLQVKLEDQQLTHLEGTIDIAQVTAQAPELQFPLTEVAGRLRLTQDQIALEAFTGEWGAFSAGVEGTVNYETEALDLQVAVQPIAIPEVLEQFEAVVPVPVDGQVEALAQVGGTVQDPIISGNFQALSPVQVDRLTLTNVASRFQVATLPTSPGQPLTVNLNQIQAFPSPGGAAFGAGQVRFSEQSSIDLDLSIDALPLESFAQLYDVPLPIFVGDVAVQAKVMGPLEAPETILGWQALQAEYPAQGVTRIRGDEIIVEDLLARVAGGTVRAKGQQAGDSWRLTAVASQLQPLALGADLPGVIDAQLTLFGPRNQFAPSAARGQGQVYFSEGISLVTNPITADVVWDGERVQVPQALAAGFVGNGVLDVVLDQGPPDITNVDLNVQLLDYTIATLLEDLPPLVNVNGSADFQGKIVGALTSLRIFGQLQVKELGVNELDFEPLLVGNLDFNPRGVGIELAGHQDQVRLGLTPEFEPTTAFVRLNQGTVQMQRDGDLYGVQIDRFPIALLPLELPEQLADQPLQGTASGQFDLALDPFNASGIFAIDQPTIGYVQAQRLQSQFRLVDNVITLENGFMQVRDSRFTFGGRGVLADDPQFELNVAVSQGDVQDVLRTLQWFDLVDVQRGLEGGLGGLQPALFDRAADVALAPLGNPRDPLRLQLHRFAEVKAKIGQTIRQRQAQKRLPPLTALAGRFDGEIKLAGSASQGVNADFNFGGDNWRWGDYTAQDLEIRGEFANNQVTLRPVRMVVEDAPISFVGTIGGEEQSGQFRVEQLPLALVQDFVDLPLDVDGAIELSANLAGSATDPQVLGELNLVDGTLNQEPLQTRNTGFNYLNGRFGFGSVLTVETDQSEPVVVSGSIPLPFGEIQPDSDELSLDLQVKNQGLELMNLLTQDQLSWLGGEGTVELQVRGTVQEPIATGTIQLNQAKMAAQVLPDGESITDLSGTIRFVQDRIQVETLTGSFSEGEITAQGMLPIALPFGLEDPDRETPLQVNIDNLNLNLPGIYRGGADGQVQVRGSLRDPSLTGAIQLSQGNIPLPDTEAVALAPAPPPETNGSNTFVINPLVFDNLRLQLQDKVEVASPPVFRFRAEGELLVNGTIDEIQPDGEIRLTRGQVSLFTTNFTLARRHKNVAVFRPETGLEPDLDVRMVAAVTEVSNRAPTAGPLTNSEIADTGSTDFSELETIRIRAEVQGPASKLLSNLELSSRPARSQSELYALMGGGFITTLGQGGDGTLALANFAGSALINSLQARINDALQGPVDFRLFPTLVDSNDRREQAEGDSNDSSGAETLALGAEVGVNLTNSLSFSVLRLLTVDIPTRFNVRYQITDNWQLRGTSDLQGDNRFVVEYEARF